MQFLFVGFAVTLGACLAVASAPTVILALVMALKGLGILVAVVLILAVVFGTRWYRRL